MPNIWWRDQPACRQILPIQSTWYSPKPCWSMSLNGCTGSCLGLISAPSPGRIACHEIDLKDHLANSLHSLRFPLAVWESKYFRTSDFYTNRLRASQWAELFVNAGYQVLRQNTLTWPRLPLSRSKLQPEFARFPDEELAICSVHFVVQK